MPIVTVSTYSGRTQTEKDRLAEAITDDIIRIWKVQKKDVIVVFQEASHGNWYASGVRLQHEARVINRLFTYDELVCAVLA